MAAKAGHGSASVRVWDPFVRVSHWVVALACFANLSFLRHADELHEWVGYAALGFVLLRIGWGFFTNGHANFRDFVPAPRALLSYVRLLFRGREPRYIGHNPAGAVMMLALMALVLLCGITGWMLGLDAFWGDSSVQAIHEAAANAILFLVILHVTGAIVESVRHRENLILSMITGRKRPLPEDVSAEQLNGRHACIDASVNRQLDDLAR